MSDDRIAALIDDLTDRCPDTATPARRRSIANSVAIGRAADITTPTYDALIGAVHAWWPTRGRADTPETTAAHIREHTPWHAAQLAQLAEQVAAHIEASTADLCDDGSTVAAWRLYACALRGAPNGIAALIDGHRTPLRIEQMHAPTHALDPNVCDHIEVWRPADHRDDE